MFITIKTPFENLIVNTQYIIYIQKGNDNVISMKINIPRESTPLIIEENLEDLEQRLNVLSFDKNIGIKNWDIKEKEDSDGQHR